MPLLLNWRVPGRVLYQQIQGDISLDEIHQWSDQVNAMMVSEGIGVVDSIIDARELKSFPRHLRDLRDVLKPGDDRQGWMMLVSANLLLRFMANVTTNLAGMRLHACNGIEEAEAFLARHDPGLAASLAPSMDVPQQS